MQQYKTPHSVKLRDFGFSNVDIVRRENDVAKLAPNFALSIMGYLMTAPEDLVTRGSGWGLVLSVICSFLLMLSVKTCQV